MKEPAYYKGREQTYIKHFFLERYLEKLAFRILSFVDDFVYVDGFSGPWNAEDIELSDTSFAIAVAKLNYVREAPVFKGKRKRIRCLFNEKDSAAFKDLEAFCDKVTGIAVQPINAQFENVVADVISFIGNSFAFVFIDPTGWTGFGLQEISPIFRQKGEVLINFMFKDINRFYDTKDQTLIPSLDKLFGGVGWKEKIDQYLAEGFSRESAVLQTYQDRLKEIGGFRYVTSARVLHPFKDQPFFHLVYGTRHPVGVLKFRETEKSTFKEQEIVREETKVARSEASSLQGSLFATEDLPNSVRERQIRKERDKNLGLAQSGLIKFVSSKGSVDFLELAAEVMQVPLVWEDDVQNMIYRMKEDGRIQIDGLRPREKKLKKGHKVTWTDTQNDTP